MFARVRFDLQSLPQPPDPAQTSAATYSGDTNLENAHATGFRASRTSATQRLAASGSQDLQGQTIYDAQSLAHEYREGSDSDDASEYYDPPQGFANFAPHKGVGQAGALSWSLYRSC